MGLIGRLVSFSFKSSFLIALIAVGIAVLPDHLFGDVKFEPVYRSAIKPDIPANLKIVQIADEDIVSLPTDKEILQPESIKIHKNLIYAATVNGKVLRIDESTGKTTVLTSLVDKEAANCENNRHAKESCGRVLDMDIAGNTLYAVDAYRGFIEYDLVKNTKISHNLRSIIPGYEQNNKIFNSIRQDPTNANIVYISLSSTKYGFDRIFYTFIEAESSGILITYNKLTKKATVIGKDYLLANGVEITSDKKSLLINDLISQRILKFDLKEVNAYVQSNGKGTLPKQSVFIDRIPGLPDNLTKHNKNLVVAIVNYIPYNNVVVDQLLSPHPIIRKTFHRILYLSSEFLKLVQKYYKCSCLEQLQKRFESGEIIVKLPFKSAISIHDQATGKYLQLLELPVKYITHAIYNEQTKSFYLGSIVHNEIKKLNFRLD